MVGKPPRALPRIPMPLCRSLCSSSHMICGQQPEQNGQSGSPTGTQPVWEEPEILAKVAPSHSNHTLQGPPTDPKARTLIEHNVYSISFAFHCPSVDWFNRCNVIVQGKCLTRLAQKRTRKPAVLDWEIGGWAFACKPSIPWGWSGRIVSSRPAYVTGHGATLPKNREKCGWE